MAFGTSIVINQHYNNIVQSTKYNFNRFQDKQASVKHINVFNS